MLTAIAVVNQELVLPPPDQYTPTAAVLKPPDEQSLVESVAEIEDLLEQHGYLIVLYAASSTSPEFARRLHTVRSVLESNRIALLPMDLPPLAVAVLVRQLRQLSLGDLSPGVLGSAPRLLAHYLYAGALLNSVAKLDRVSVSLRTHVKSWLPGVQFGVMAHPTPQLIKIGTDDPPPGPGFATHLTVAAAPAFASEWVTGTVAPNWQVQAVQETPLPSESTRWWGTSKMVEFTAAIPDPVVLYQLVNSVRREPCHWCGLEFIGDRCAFCSAPLAQPENQDGPSSVSNHQEASVSGPSQ
ncbi:hypothetical protein [Streptomyces sp. TP-A0874]|uniref:hypothetical protein n=1 Tax=Streptomyces sp. TP-A0874 TaxID=549819 RepID=UPI000852E026|nr:hypothetical protein [Streptomyces sp. TP-A0874]